MRFALIDYRREAGLTRVELAARSGGVSASTINAIENGRVREPRPTTLEMLAKGLGLTGRRRAEFVTLRGTRT